MNYISNTRLKLTDPTPTGLIEAHAVKAFHMPSYLLGTPDKVFLLNTGEVCQTQFDPADARHAWFAKNIHGEEFGNWGGFVRRGTDTSPDPLPEKPGIPVYYQQWTTTGKLGAPWCPEWWTLNDPYLRECEVRYFEKATGKEVKRYVESTYLEAVAHYPTKTFPSGVTVEDVLELKWYRPDHKGPVLESYFYARGWGLVAFQNAHGFSSYIVKKTFAIAPIRQQFAGVEPMTLPVVTPPPVEEAPQWLERALNAGANMRIREPFPDGRPNPKGRELILVPDGELIDVDIRSVTRPDGQDLEWVRVQWLDQRDADALKLYKGWMGILKGKTLETQFVAPPTGEPIPPPDPDETDETPVIKFVTVDEAQEMADAAKRQAVEYLEPKIATLLDRINALERVLRAHSLKINEELPLAG